MIRKTVRLFRRRADSGVPSGEKHVDRVLRETWWLLGVVPLYSRDTIVNSGL